MTALELASEAAEPTLLAAVTLDVFSDAICPWCYVAKRRVEAATVVLAGQGVALSVRWRAFQLNPEMPVEGLDRKAYRTRKFGSWERSLALDSQVAAAGRQDGIVFRHDLMQRTPNTLDAHRVAWMAERSGKQDQVIEAILRAYFCEGRDIGDRDVLAELAASEGLNREQVRAELEAGVAISEVLGAGEAARSLGLTSVPTALLNGRVLFSGAQPATLIAKEVIFARLGGRTHG